MKDAKGFPARLFVFKVDATADPDQASYIAERYIEDVDAEQHGAAIATYELVDVKTLHVTRELVEEA